MSQTPEDNLPKQFVLAMRTLFDIMDDKKCGFVKLTDIEKRWRDDRTKGLPKGVLECLQKVTPHDGLLSFERFCAGLKICLLRNQAESNRRSQDQQVQYHIDNNIAPNKGRPSSAPILDLENTPPQKQDWKIREDTNGQQRIVHSSHHIARKEQIVDVLVHRYNEDIDSAYYGPPKPPRLSSNLTSDRHSNEQQDVIAQMWKREKEKEDRLKADEQDYGLLYLARSGRSAGDGKSAADQLGQQKKSNRRREPRRHTLQNGIDYNMLKRLKQIEQEKDILMEGLTAIEKAREWYIKQLAEVQDKMRFASRMGTHVEQWSESQQERLELQRARILELNRQLGALADSWHRGGLSLHMNLALAPHTLPAHAANTLKSQNHILNEEMSKKNERISILEREKSALIRELLTITNRNKGLEAIY